MENYEFQLEPLEDRNQGILGDPIGHVICGTIALFALAVIISVMIAIFTN